jgi:serine/threonine protein kinase
MVSSHDLYSAEVKLINFWVQKPSKIEIETDLKSIKGFLSYLAPEFNLNSQGPPTKSGDMWSAGIVMFTLLSGG